MKIGMSYSRCVKDIYDGKIDIDDVLVIITRTDFAIFDEKQWNGIWFGYTHRGDWPYDTYNKEIEKKFQSITQELESFGKLHQPRQHGYNPSKFPYTWLDVFATSEDMANNPAAKRALANYQMLANLI